MLIFRTIPRTSHWKCRHLSNRDDNHWTTNRYLLVQELYLLDFNNFFLILSSFGSVHGKDSNQCTISRNWSATPYHVSLFSRKRYGVHCRDKLKCFHIRLSCCGIVLSSMPTSSEQLPTAPTGLSTEIENQQPILTKEKGTCKNLK